MGREVTVPQVSTMKNEKVERKQRNRKWRKQEEMAEKRRRLGRGEMLGTRKGEGWIERRGDGEKQEDEVLKKRTGMETEKGG